MNMIVMMDDNGCIGINGDQPIRLNEDLKRFKEMTTEKTVVCGRKTVETFPHQLPLPGRSTIVISKTLSLTSYLNITNRNSIIVRDPFEVVKLLKDINSSNVWVIGGASIYRELLPWTNRVFITQVHTKFVSGIITSMDNMQKMRASTKVYFPINIIDQQFEIVETTNIDDYDRLTNKKYKTTFSEYVRL